MARTTTNYGFNISEGSDLVNPLTDIFPNFELIDSDLKDVSDASIGVATELKTGTVHALTRTDTAKDVFKFTATSNFTAGDTFTVDSEQVSALTTSGEQLTTGCYIIGSEVLVAKKGTLLTFYISNVITDASTLEGHSASYFATASDLSSTDADVLNLSNKVGSAILTTDAQDCSGAINELHADLSALSSLSLVENLVTLNQTKTVSINDYKEFQLEIYLVNSTYNQVVVWDSCKVYVSNIISWLQSSNMASYVAYVGVSAGGNNAYANVEFAPNNNDLVIKLSALGSTGWQVTGVRVLGS